jgi:histidine ammonia-lyase/phenylalanine ammonia-lyase
VLADTGAREETAASALDGDSLTLGDVDRVSVRAGSWWRIGRRAEERMRASVAARDGLVASGRAVYGITTGFGDGGGRQVSSGHRKTEALQRNLLRFSRAGVGPYAPDEVVRATLLIRANCLSRGVSGIRPEVVQALLDLLAHDVLPVVPERGSVGASGDVAPLSYIAAALCGEGRVRTVEGELSAGRGLKAYGLQPVALEAKEGLALVSGTSFMAAYAALAVCRAREVAWAAEICTAMAAEVRRGPAGQFDVFPHLHKPHPGQVIAADHIRAMLDGSRLLVDDSTPAETGKSEHGGYVELSRPIQDPYSIRCAPHVIGVLWDVIEVVERWLTVEINSANDNPLIDGDTGGVFNCGNFYGGHVAHAASSLTLAVASVADLLDRQLQLLVDDRRSHGLTPNLVMPVDEHDFDAGLHHGFKGAQITASALTAEALHLTLPASAFSRSTEAHHQDVVSMGTIAARHARTAVELATQVAGIHLLASAQAADLRGGGGMLAPSTSAAHQAVRALVPFMDRDRPLDEAIRDAAGLVRSGVLRAAVAGE